MCFLQCEAGSWSKQFEVEFHSSTVHELHEIVIGLRTVAGHVIKVSKHCRTVIHIHQYY